MLARQAFYHLSHSTSPTANTIKQAKMRNTLGSISMFNDKQMFISLINWQIALQKGFCQSTFPSAVYQLCP
jgi:TfoX/Sxy family transcriptional regulator of competence genes